MCFFVEMPANSPTTLVTSLGFEEYCKLETASQAFSKTSFSPIVNHVHARNAGILLRGEVPAN